MAARSADPTLRPLEEHDFAAVEALARKIWLAHYTTLVTTEQIEYMLRGRFTADNLRTYLRAERRWMDLLEIDGELTGYCSYALTSDPGEMKLEQIYLLPHLHGRGFGARMLEHVARRALSLGAHTLMLTVNKRNDKALEFYARVGFAVRAEAVFDIGGGYVMDDYVMEKRLSGIDQP